MNTSVVLKYHDLSNQLRGLRGWYKPDELIANLKKEKLLVTSFIVLNMVDAYLTRTAIALGSSELNPVVMGFGDSILLKALISVTIVIALLLLHRAKLLKPLNVGMLCVVLWNIVAVWTWS